MVSATGRSATRGAAAAGPEVSSGAPFSTGGAERGSFLTDVSVGVTLAAMVALAGVVLGRVYAGGLLTGLVAGAAAGSVLVGLVCRRLPSWLVAPLSVLGMTAWTLWSLRLAASRAELSGPLVEVTADATGNGIPRLLTAMIPVEPTPDTVLVPVVAAWLAGLAGTEVALRAGRVLLGYLPPALLYTGALYVVGPNADPAVRPTLAFAAVAVLGLVVRRAGTTVGDPTAGLPPAGLPPAGRATVRGRLAGASVAGVAVVVAAALLGPALAARVGGQPVDPRRYVEPPRVDTLDENPLIRISGWALHPDQKLLDVTTQPATGAARIRLAVLSDYDGVTWRVGATYRNAGRILPAAAPAADSTVDTVRQEITVAGLTGRLLPAVATPREVTGARVAYDPETATLIRPEGLTPGLRYAVASAREHPDVNLLATANVPAGAEAARVLRVADGVPDPLRRLATQLAESNAAPYSRAAAVEQFLAEHYRLVADAPSGHAYPNLAFFLFGPRNAGGQRGTSEQFAAAFAVLGRLVGLPTRVVVGFRSPGSGPVRAGDAYAWPEVRFDGLGWVPFDPLPRLDTAPRPVEEDFRPRPTEPPPSEAPRPTVEPTASPEPAAAPGRPVGPGVPPVPVLLAFAVGGALLVVAALLLTLWWRRRSLSRSRLARGDPGERVAGAWREVTDALRLAGHPAAGDLAASEVAARAREVLAAARTQRSPAAGAGHADRRGVVAGGQARPEPGRVAAPVRPEAGVTDLADLLNQVAFAPGTVTEAESARAVAAAQAYVAALRAARPWWRRLRWSVHPGPLRGAGRSG
ncbi:transglutaminaseTgpA domain-containing protein [Micromonospora sp. WMMA1363]|uniref:transglutaminase domain-containing protein n=1 Tax=Micromonospora sp. WMMA1363 TaxID=3053985 RepID=UPI00259C9BE0|nr:transglutaminase domain-containing protein [Micromonospora sp. WMMA1363]MDM4719742.1 transglutaminaseTgpA domain-containing protein [Micromonospora sp. WMMA1363]